MWTAPGRWPWSHSSCSRTSTITTPSLASSRTSEGSTSSTWLRICLTYSAPETLMALQKIATRRGAPGRVTEGRLGGIAATSCASSACATASSSCATRSGAGSSNPEPAYPGARMPARVRLALMVAATLALVAALVVVLVARPGTSAGEGGWAGALAPEMPPQDLTLHDQDGRRVALRDLRGQVVVLTFMYTHCRDVCPTTAVTIRGALDDLGHDVPTLAVSVDPAGDTPSAAQRFLFARHLDGRMRFLLGSRAELEPVWRRFGIQPQGADFDHSARVVVLDRTG